MLVARDSVYHDHIKKFHSGPPLVDIVGVKLEELNTKNTKKRSPRGNGNSPPRTRYRSNSGSKKVPERWNQGSSGTDRQYRPNNLIVPVVPISTARKALPTELQHPNWMNLTMGELFRPEIVKNVNDLYKCNADDMSFKFWHEWFTNTKPVDIVPVMNEPMVEATTPTTPREPNTPMTDVV
jgi:hypothetical protein